MFNWFRFSKKKSGNTNITPPAPTAPTDPVEVVEEPEEEVFIDEDGRRFKLVERIREVPRKTYIHGYLTGKYWGELDLSKEQAFERHKFFDFNIYEAEVKTKSSNKNCFCTSSHKPECDGFHTEWEGKFNFQPDDNFPKEKLPHTIPCSISLKGSHAEYSVVLHEPQVRAISFSRKLHQDEGPEVFGTIEAEITGYILDFKKESYTQKEYLTEQGDAIPIQASPAAPERTKTYVPTGQTEYRGGYKRVEYYYSDYKTRYWGKWIYAKRDGATSPEGCLSATIGAVGTITGFVFLLLLLPRLVILLPLILILLVLNLIPANIWVWVLRITGAFLLVLFFAGLFSSLTKRKGSRGPRELVREEREERVPEYIPFSDTLNSGNLPDTLVTHFRQWKDYAGNSYEGKFWVKQSALQKAHAYKNNLNILPVDERSYDEVVFRLKEHDMNGLAGIFQLFDSIKTAASLSEKDFAEMVVSFVQAIPYSVVLPEACDPGLYSDAFIRRYLSSENARCAGHEKFGINTPVEFMASLQGDCDTRTLFLYTILSHYGFDVTLLSSELYNHSLLGIHLPYDGLALKYHTQRYVLWETTAPGVLPGVLPKEISNVDYWRISLKSK